MLKKFNINDRLRQLPKRERVLLRRAIAKEMGRSREHVSRLLNAPLYSKKDFPSEVIIKLSYIFKCKPEELYNISLEPINLTELEYNESVMSEVEK